MTERTRRQFLRDSVFTTAAAMVSAAPMIGGARARNTSANNILTLNRTLRHLTDNGVDLDKYPISMGPLLEFDPNKEVFTNSAEANAILHREYRAPFVCPTPDKV